MLSVFVYNGKYGLKDELQVFTPKGTATLMTDRGVIHGDGLYYSNLKYYEESEVHKSDIQPYYTRLLLALIKDQESIKERQSNPLLYFFYKSVTSIHPEGY